MSISEKLDRVLVLSKQILQMADQQDIENLATLESERRTLLASLPSSWAGISSLEAERVHHQIEEILFLNSEAQELLQPWREQMAKLLSRFHPGTP